MKKILGLDLGTNSIGWAVVSTNENGKPQQIEGMGSRIIPMDAALMGNFDAGNSVSQTATRTAFRGVRRLRERNLQRRERLHRVLNILEFLPEHYANQIGFDKAEPKYLGKFLNDAEPKLAWQEIMREDKKHFEFLFMDSFKEMLADFTEHQPNLVANGNKIPIDWTIYYLRKKALTQQITKEELAWILLNFNQKRGYYQLRGEDEETKDKNELVIELKVIKIVKGDVDKKNNKRTWYNIQLENGWDYSVTFTTEPNWLNQTKEFLITEELDNEGKIKIVKDKKSDVTGKEKRRITILPSFEEIDLMSKEEQDKIYKKIKAKTEITIQNSNKTVGTYIYDTLLQKPSQKIKGKLVRTIERKFYRQELEAILQKQAEFHFNDKEELLKKCVLELYQNNENHRNNIANYSFPDLFIKDIIFYQRPLKSKKSLISDCPFESKFSEKGEKYGIKCIAKSNPFFQEFRLWKFVANLKIYEREKSVEIKKLQPSLFDSVPIKVATKLQSDVDVTAEFLKNEEDYVALFEWLNDRKEVEQKTFLKYPAFGLKKNADNYRWNYVEDKAYPCNETRNLMLNKLEKANIKLELLEEIGKKILENNLSNLTKKIPKDEKHKEELKLAVSEAQLECSLLDKLPNFGRTKVEEYLWHILYSVEDKFEIEKALQSFAKKHALSDDFVENFKNCKPFKKEYGSFSEKAIKKLLPVMRMGKYWSEEAIDAKTKERISKILTGGFDEKNQNRVREKSLNLTDISQFKALPEWLASYIVYDRFSEAKDICKWEKVEDLDKFINAFKQHSLRNPIVEQVILETLRTVRDIWKKEGQIDEIHVELGREMKNPADKRKQMTAKITANENTNFRIKAMLMEFKSAEYQIDGVIPHSPTQQEILKIYEEYALGNLSKEDSDFEFVAKIANMSLPTKAEIQKYKLWLEQKYRSPYTGEMIPLSKLFTSDYEREHIIPQSLFFDDSFGNKVICEAEVNKLKNSQLGYEFIKNHHGQKVELSHGKIVTIFSVEAYEKFVKDTYGNLYGKMKKLLMDEIPEKFIERQLNDTRYISKEIKRLLSNIVREKLENGEYEAEATSKNVISVTGAITSILKQDWGVNEQWNALVLPRFERLNELTNSNDFTANNTQGHPIPRVPFELQKGFSTKRIDHRHHAMDAVVIACATRSHVNYLNNENANKKGTNDNGGIRYDLKHTLCFKSKTDDKGNYKWVFHKPWATFRQDVKTALDETIISIKKNVRVINKNVNYYKKFFDDGKKKSVKQEQGENWAIRKPMHKETVFGEVNLRKIKEVGLSIALENPKSIVEKDLKEKIVELKTKGLDVKKIKTYFEDNKEVWSEVNLAKIKFYYFTKDTKERFFATRKAIDTSFNKKKITEQITDIGIQKILLKHLETNENNPELAFSPEGIEEMNKNMIALNNGKNHQPIYKVRWYEKADKFEVGQKGNKSSKFVEAAKGTNLFFAVYQKETYNEAEDKTIITRNYETIPLHKVIERQKQGLSSAPETNENGDKLLFTLSPNDLVYVPTAEELRDGIGEMDMKRIYKMVSSSGNQCFFVISTIASVIKDKFEFSALNKMERSITGEMIKEICIPIKVDRLGNIRM